MATRLGRHAREQWSALARVRVRFRANFAYVDGELVDGTVIELCRLRHGGSASSWGFAIYLASRDGYRGLDAAEWGVRRFPRGGS